MVKSSGVKRTWLKSSSCLKTLFVTSIVFETRQHYLLASCDRLLLAHPKRAHSSRCIHTDWMKQIGDLASIFFFPSIMYPWHEAIWSNDHIFFLHGQLMLLIPLSRGRSEFSNVSPVQTVLVFSLRRFQYHASRKHRSLLRCAGPGAQPTMCFPG